MSLEFTKKFGTISCKSKGYPPVSEYHAGINITSPRNVTDVNA
ncbi:MAG: hypothetical protein ACTSQQ_09925 [Candidatus Helarchaeota archaeon]